MILIEILENPNCEAVPMRIFHDLEPARPVRRVRLQQGEEVDWYDVTGWSAQGAPAPAVAQKVDDSGEGVAFLVCGADAGLRLRPAKETGPWRLEEPGQWGEPFLLVSDLDDLELANG